MAAKVDFDGPTRNIIVKAGVVDLDVQVDLYSDWKEWVKEIGSANAKFPAAFRNTGGDPLTGAQTLGRYFFLINNWQLIPTSGTLGDVSIDGNIFQEDGLPIVNNSGSDVQLWQNTVSSLTLINEVSTSAPAGLTPEQEAKLNATYGATGETTGSVNEIIVSQSLVAGDLTEIITSQSFHSTNLGTIITSQSLADAKLDILITAGGSLTPSQSIQLDELHKVMGLDQSEPLHVTPYARTVSSSISQSIETAGEEVIVTRIV